MLTFEVLCVFTLILPYTKAPPAKNNNMKMKSALKDKIMKTAFNLKFTLKPEICPA